MLDVAIAGGGPAGLAAAKALVTANPRLQVQVFESVQAYRPQGAGVLLDLNGQNALESIDPALYARFRQQSHLTNRSTQFDLEDQEVRRYEVPADDLLQRYGKRPFLLAWHKIRQLLFESLPDGTVAFDHKATSYEEDDDGVTLHFSGGRAPVRARVLVAADGYFSRLRAQLLDDGPPPSKEVVMWRAILPWRPGLPDEFSLSWLEPGTRFYEAPFSLVFPLAERQVCWVAAAPLAALQAAGLSTRQGPGAASIHSDGGGGGGEGQLDNLQRCLRVFSAFPERLRSIMSSTDPATVTEHGLYERPPDEFPDTAWAGPGCRLTLIGDAAHAAPPNGQGLNLSLEDAALLGWHLARRGAGPAALRAFEAEALPRARLVLTRGMEGAPDPAEREHVIRHVRIRRLQDALTVDSSVETALYEVPAPGNGAAPSWQLHTTATTACAVQPAREQTKRPTLPVLRWGQSRQTRLPGLHHRRFVSGSWRTGGGAVARHNARLCM